MAKVLCEACGSSFPFDRVKGLANCPICGAALWDGDAKDREDSDPEAGETEKGLMYFDEIVRDYTEDWEYNRVRAYCRKCGESNSLSLDKFVTLWDDKFVILKDNVTVTCRSCGREHKPRKIFYKKRPKSDPPLRLRHCPVCNSIMVKEISTGSKFLAAAVLGGFAFPYNSKTYECKACGHLF